MRLNACHSARLLLIGSGGPALALLAAFAQRSWLERRGVKSRDDSQRSNTAIALLRVLLLEEKPQYAPRGTSRSPSNHCKPRDSLLRVSYPKLSTSHMRPSWGHLGACLGHLGATLGHLGATLGHLEATMQSKSQNIVFFPIVV